MSLFFQWSPPPTTYIYWTVATYFYSLPAPLFPRCATSVRTCRRTPPLLPRRPDASLSPRVAQVALFPARRAPSRGRPCPCQRSSPARRAPSAGCAEIPGAVELPRRPFSQRRSLDGASSTAPPRQRIPARRASQRRILAGRASPRRIPVRAWAPLLRPRLLRQKEHQ